MVEYKNYISKHRIAKVKRNKDGTHTVTGLSRITKHSNYTEALERFKEHLAKHKTVGCYCFAHDRHRFDGVDMDTIIHKQVDNFAGYKQLENCNAHVVSIKEIKETGDVIVEVLITGAEANYYLDDHPDSILTVDYAGLMTRVNGHPTWSTLNTFNIQVKNVALRN